MSTLGVERLGGRLLSLRAKPCCSLELRAQLHTTPPCQRLSRLHARPRTASTSRNRHAIRLQASSARSQSQLAGLQSAITIEDSLPPPSATPQSESSIFIPPSPSASAAASSAKLNALHARLSLPSTLPIETLARTLVDRTADPNPNFNNDSLSILGSKLLALHVMEYLIMHYPRLPLAPLYAAIWAYSGPPTMNVLIREWGVETAAAPGAEVDPGLLQYARVAPGTPINDITRSPGKQARVVYRRGMAGRVIYDDEFGDVTSKTQSLNAQQELTTDMAASKFVRALLGALLLHAGRDSAKAFIKAHILSRHLKTEHLFKFSHPVRDLARLCAREGFEYPVARMLSETGRTSRAPVYVVGIYSGADKLGEGSGASPDEARLRAAAAALKSWYLYSPGNDLRLPSDIERPGVKDNASDQEPAPWTPAYIDIGEVI